MQEIRYHKDLNHNYLIIKREKDKETTAGFFRLRMLTENQLKYFLPCFVRKVNNVNFTYYEISSRQSMSNMTLIRELGWIELLALFQSLEEAAREADEYLLPVNGIMLHPDLIFVDPEKSHYSFLYDPESEDHQLMLDEFSSFLISKIDHKEEKSVQIAYYIYEQIQQRSFILSDILYRFRILCEEKVENDCRSEEITYSIPQNKIDEQTLPCEKLQQQVPEKEESSEGEEWPEEDWSDHENWSDDEAEEESVNQSEEQKRKLVVTSGLLLLCLAGAGGLLYCRFAFSLSALESLLAILAAIILFIVALLLVRYLASVPIRKQHHKSPNFLGENVSFQSESLMKHETTGVEEEILLQEIQLNKMNMNSNQIVSGREPDKEYGNTVFILLDSEERENKLYSMNKGKKHHITLEKLPFTVGKMAGGVDAVIKDESVSRIHARFHESEGILLITDLNSTNGTFKNGLRMEPNSSQPIEPGDEIRIGQLNYIFR